MARRLIAVVGPTAAGKTAAALGLAAELPVEVVSCDSLQVYRGLDIGSAKPSAAERAAVRHHLVDVVDPDAPFSAADWVRLCREALDDVRARGRLPVIVGGTGLYLRALLHGLFEGPGRDEPLRARLEGLADRHGSPRLHRLLAHLDPETAGRVEPADRLRIIRALEVYRHTGQPISALRREGTQGLQGWEVRLLGLDPGRAALRPRIEERTDAMLRAGLVEEVRGLLARYPPDLRPLRAIGYREAVEVVQGLRPVDAARRDIVTATLRYAKRQRTWFRHQATVTWFEEPGALVAAAVAWAREVG